MFRHRIVTGLIIGAIALLINFLLPIIVFNVITGIVILTAAWEWTFLSDIKKKSLQILYMISMSILLFLSFFFTKKHFFLGIGFSWWLIAIALITSYPASKDAWNTTLFRSIMGYLVLLPTAASLFFIRSQENGSMLIFYLLSLVALTDMSAYFFGRWLGRTKLAVHISPNKTWEGLICSGIIILFSSVLMTQILNLTLQYSLAIILVSFIIFIFAVFGDLLESMLKREANLKDSGKLLPGHGGILDRIDSLTAAAPIFAIFCMLVYSTH